MSPWIAKDQRQRLTNWAGNIEYSTDRVFYPASATEAQELVKKLDRLKVLGTRHCFNRIADSRDNLVSLKKMDQIIQFDPRDMRVTVGPGVTYGKLGPFLQDKGYALHNLASLPHISVAGACMTGTHGSGTKNQNLSSAVRALEFIAADGQLHHISRERDGDRFFGAVVGLGALGLVTQIQLAIEPTYMMQQRVFENLPLQALKDHFDEIVSSGYSVSLFTDWQSDEMNEVWVKSKVGEPGRAPTSNEFFGARAATKNLHPIAALSAENCTPQMGEIGPWFERLPHFKMGFTPSSGKELQAEYFVPHHHALEAIQAIARMGKEISPYLFISEIRTIAADELWMSPCFQERCVTIHFTWKQDWPAVSKLLPVIERELQPFQARPHWGKLFAMSPLALQSRYSKLGDFKRLISEFDPKGKFRNDFLDRNLYTG